MTEHCAAFTALLVRAAEDVLPAEDRARLDTHLLDCPACREDWPISARCARGYWPNPSGARRSGSTAA
ncbi:MAG: zf-HC2 domain-containing protein [Acidobacteria bacterium]|nr:zf-HC2 domain-containing protein [Acidobacteriota bacterium]